MHKINKISSPMCNCKEEEETVEHFIYRCPNHALLRKKLIKMYEQMNIDFHPPTNIFAGKKELWNELVHFVKATGRLDLGQ